MALKDYSEKQKKIELNKEMQEKQRVRSASQHVSKIGSVRQNYEKINHEQTYNTLFRMVTRARALEEKRKNRDKEIRN